MCSTGVYLQAVITEHPFKTTLLESFLDLPLPYIRPSASCPSSLPHQFVTAPSANKFADVKVTRPMRIPAAEAVNPGHNLCQSSPILVDLDETHSPSPPHLNLP